MSHSLEQLIQRKKGWTQSESGQEHFKTRAWVSPADHSIETSRKCVVKSQEILF
jgi:hypothetical protein